MPIIYDHDLSSLDDAALFDHFNFVDLLARAVARRDHNKTDIAALQQYRDAVRLECDRRDMQIHGA